MGALARARNRAAQAAARARHHQEPGARAAARTRPRPRSRDREVMVMAEYRPYRVANQRAQARLTQVKLISVSSFIGLALLINWMVTQHAARLFGYSRALGPALIGGLYAPWEWMLWWSRWQGADQLEPVWQICCRETAYQLLGLSVLTAATIIIARPSIAWNGLRPAWVSALGDYARRSRGGPGRTPRVPATNGASVGCPDRSDETARAPGRNLSGNLA